MSEGDRFSALEEELGQANHDKDAATTELAVVRKEATAKERQLEARIKTAEADAKSNYDRYLQFHKDNTKLQSANAKLTSETTKMRQESGILADQWQSANGALSAAHQERQKLERDKAELHRQHAKDLEYIQASHGANSPSNTQQTQAIIELETEIEGMRGETQNLMDEKQMAIESKGRELTNKERELKGKIQEVKARDTEIAHLKALVKRLEHKDQSEAMEEAHPVLEALGEVAEGSQEAEGEKTGKMRRGHRGGKKKARKNRGKASDPTGEEQVETGEAAVSGAVSLGEELSVVADDQDDGSKSDANSQHAVSPPTTPPKSAGTQTIHPPMYTDMRMANSAELDAEAGTQASPAAGEEKATQTAPPPAQPTLYTDLKSGASYIFRAKIKVALQLLWLLLAVAAFCLCVWSVTHQRLAFSEREIWQSANDLTRRSVIALRKSQERGYVMGWISEEKLVRFEKSPYGFPELYGRYGVEF